MRRLRAPKTDAFFAPETYRADTALPALKSIDVSFNNLTATSIDETMPASINRFDISSNPLRSGCANLLKALGRLTHLKELRLVQAEIGNDAFPASLFADESSPYPKLQVLDVGNTQVTEEAVRDAFLDIRKVLDFDATVDDPPEGTIKVSVGKKVIKESWEIEAERGGRRKFHSVSTVPSSIEARPQDAGPKESWELEAEQGLLTEGGRRRARAAAAAVRAELLAEAPAPPAPAPKKEPWELRADDVLSAGALRLKRAKAAEAAEAAAVAPPEKPASPTSVPSVTLATSKYYSPNTLTLTLPSTTALPSKNAAHGRSFSVATSAWSKSAPSDLAIPTATLPLAFIVSQPIALTLKILELNSRRMDQSFSLPPPSSSNEELLPHLEELSLEGCGLGDQIPVSEHDQLSSRTTESLLPLLTKLFPSVVTLNLTYNALTSKSLTAEALAGLILNKRKPLKHLRLRGNRITELDGFQGLTEPFKGHQKVPDEWKMEELDLRDNEIGRLPAELGLLPLDVFLVDGNTCVVLFCYVCLLTLLIGLGFLRGGFGSARVRRGC